MNHRALLGTFAFLVFLLVGCSQDSPDAAATKKEKSQGKPTPQQVQSASRLLDAYAGVETRPLSLEEFGQAVRSRALADVGALSVNEREKLFTCIDQFYRCYSSGDFEAFKRFRLRPPYAAGERMAGIVKEIASRKGLALRSDEEVLRFAWDHYNGTNRIGEVSEQSIVVSIAERQDLGPDLRQPSARTARLAGLGASCWEGAVVNQPAPAELLKDKGSLRFFTLEVSVRFSPLTAGPASPLVLLGYWDPTREDWMPCALCTAFHFSNYDTIF